MSAEKLASPDEACCGKAVLFREVVRRWSRRGHRIDVNSAAGKPRPRVATELIGDIERVYQRKNVANKELTELVAATGSILMDLHGIVPSAAVRLLVEAENHQHAHDVGRVHQRSTVSEIVADWFGCSSRGGC